MGNADNTIGSADAARILGISRSHLQRLASAGEIPTLAKLPGPVGAYVFDRSAVEDYASERAGALT